MSNEDMEYGNSRLNGNHSFLFDAVTVSSRDFLSERELSGTGFVVTSLGTKYEGDINSVILHDYEVFIVVSKGGESVLIPSGKVEVIALKTDEGTESNE